MYDDRGRIMVYVVTEYNKPISIRPYLRTDGMVSWAVDKCHTTTKLGKPEGVIVASVKFMDYDYDFYVVVDSIAWSAALKDKRKMTALRNLSNGVKARAVDAGIKICHLPAKHLVRAFVQGLAR
jgi:hypothetical protein